MAVAQLHVGAFVVSVVSGLVEDDSILGRWNVLAPVDVGAFQRELAVGELQEQVLEPAPVNILRHAVVNILELRVVQAVVALAVLQGPGQEDLQPIVEAVAVRQPAGKRIVSWPRPPMPRFP